MKDLEKIGVTGFTNSNEKPSELIIPIKNLYLKKYEEQINSWLTNATKNAYEFKLVGEGSCSFMRKALIGDDVNLSIEYDPDKVHIKVYKNHNLSN